MSVSENTAIRQASTGTIVVGSYDKVLKLSYLILFFDLYFEFKMFLFSSKLSIEERIGVPRRLTIPVNMTEMSQK